MSRPVLYIAITNHGFGHAVRMASVAKQIQKLNPDILLVIVTTAPRWLIESYLEGDFIYRLQSFDVGVIQSDSIQMDVAGTLRKMEDYRAKEQEIVAREVEYIQINRISLMLADIPAMTTKIAAEAGIPCWMMGNFGWDFIYQPWQDEFGSIIDWLREGYSKCNRLFRLPFAEPMSCFPHQEDVGLTGGVPRYKEDELRAKYDLTTPKEKTILLTFGGLGLNAIPYQNLTDFSDWQFITFDKNAPDMPNLLKITDNIQRPVDFLPITGKVLCKPGFSTFAECMRLDVPMISVTREGFNESQILLNDLRKYSYHRIVNRQDFYETDWDFLKQDLLPPTTNEKLDKYGGEYIANEVANYFFERY